MEPNDLDRSSRTREYCTSSWLVWGELLYGYYVALRGTYISVRHLNTMLLTIRCKSRRYLETSRRMAITISIKVGENYGLLIEP